MEEGSRQIIFQGATLRRFLVPIVRSNVNEQLDIKARFDNLAASAMGIHDNFFDRNGTRRPHLKSNELDIEYFGAQMRLRPKQGVLDFGDGKTVKDEGILVNTVAIGRFKASSKEEGLFVTFAVKTDGAGEVIYQFIKRVRGHEVDIEITRADEDEEARIKAQIEGQGELFPGADGDGEGPKPDESDVDDALSSLERLETGKEQALEPPVEAQPGVFVLEPGSKHGSGDEWPAEREDGTYDPDLAEKRTMDSRDGSQVRIYWLEMVSGFVSGFECSFTVGDRRRRPVELRAPVYPSERQAISCAAQALADYACSIVEDKADKTINKKQRDECRRIITWAAQYVDSAIKDPPPEDEADAAEA